MIQKRKSNTWVSSTFMKPKPAGWSFRKEESQKQAPLERLRKVESSIGPVGHLWHRYGPCDADGYFCGVLQIRDDWKEYRSCTTTSPG